MAKVILIDPLGFLNIDQGAHVFPNVGIAYLVSSLKSAGHECLVIDCNNNVVSDASVFDRIQDYRPDLVGFSIKSSTAAESRRLAEEVKKHYPNIPIIAGGLHATIAWRDLVVQPWFDIVFIGEGEKILPEICKRLLAGTDIMNLPGVLTKGNYETDVSGKQYLTPALELNDLPVPAYELFSEGVQQSLKKEYPLVTSRGCVYRCAYCSVPKINGKICRMRSSASVIAELQEAHRKYGTTAFQVIDDLFNFDTSRCKQICMVLIESGLSMQWSCPNGLRADRIDSELAGLMYQAGCRSVNVGIESVDRDVLAAISKGETIESIERGIRIFQSAGISVGGFFIIGLPGDSLRAQKRNLAFVKKIGIGALFGMFVPYPGTELWDWAKKNARFTRSFEDGLHYSVTSAKPESIIETVDFSAADRLRAYEMIYTRMGQFSRLIPSGVRGLRSLLRVITLLWKYDKGSLVPYIVKAMINKAKRMAKR
ncbi:MAG: radical SAM protein [Candidatus Omnitrophota bacterium]